MELNRIVIVSLTAPKEKIWGQLLLLNPAGVTVRGIDLASFDDFVQQLLDQEEGTVGMATVFYPMHRVERVAADEPSGTLPSLADRFKKKVGITVQEYLGLETPRGLGVEDELHLRPGMTVAEAERLLILETLASTENNKTRAAEMLGISLKTLHSKLRDYDQPQS